MKQLIHSCCSGSESDSNNSTDRRHVIVAFHDTVYYFCDDNNNNRQFVYELEIERKSSPVKNNNSTKDKDEGDNGTSTTTTQSSAVVEEANTKTKTVTTTTATATNNANDPYEVQAVAVTVVDHSSTSNTSTVWCAVARYDKTLQIYSIPTTTTTTTTVSDNDNNSSSTKDALVKLTIYPQTIHITSKRVSSISFATVYGETIQDSILTVVVCGDVVGDATAYSLLHTAMNVADINNNDNGNNDDPNNENYVKDNDTNDDQNNHNAPQKQEQQQLLQYDEIVTPYKRLLLGHTASMLTSVHIVKYNCSNDTIISPTSIEQQQQQTQLKQFILTSDRDEKIRVSQFPETYTIEGYLLGHTAFITSVDILPQHLTKNHHHNYCVSVGGDCTIRLWDYISHSELLSVSTCNPLPALNSNERDNNIKTSEEAEVTTIYKNENDETTVDTSIPTKVIVSTDGTILATLYDDNNRIDFWTIRYDTDTVVSSQNKVPVSIDRIYTLETPMGQQPLGMIFINHDTFILLLQEPVYIEQYKIHFSNEEDSDSGDKSVVHIRDIVTTRNLFCDTIQQMNMNQDIVMMDGLLEKDDYGCIKMSKMSERRGGASIKPWNDISRKETNAERIKRLRKRRREEFIRQREEAKQKMMETTL